MNYPAHARADSVYGSAASAPLRNGLRTALARLRCRAAPWEVQRVKRPKLAPQARQSKAAEPILCYFSLQKQRPFILQASPRHERPCRGYAVNRTGRTWREHARRFPRWAKRITNGCGRLAERARQNAPHAGSAQCDQKRGKPRVLCKALVFG